MNSKIIETLPGFLKKKGVKLELFDHGTMVKAVITWNEYRSYIYISKNDGERNYYVHDLITRFLYEHGLEVPFHKRRYRV